MDTLTLVAMGAVLATTAALFYLGTRDTRVGHNVGSAKATIQRLMTALTVYEGEFGDYPPTFHAFESNRINEGNESLVACLSTKEKGGPFFDFKVDKLQNVDQDRAPAPLSVLFGSLYTRPDLWEYLDPWERPYVYFHGRELATQTTARYQLHDVVREIQPVQSASAPSASKYQVFSLGENGARDDPSAGEGDDIGSWVR